MENVCPFTMTAVILAGRVGVVLARYVSEFAASAASFLGVCGLSEVSGDDSLVIDEHLIEGAKRRFWPVVLTLLAAFAGSARLVLKGVAQGPFVIPFSASLAVRIVVIARTPIGPASPVCCPA